VRKFLHIDSQAGFANNAAHSDLVVLPVSSPASVYLLVCLTPTPSSDEGISHEEKYKHADSFTRHEAGKEHYAKA
jgi:hypothetical protein